MIWCSQKFNSDLPDYGIPLPLFVLVEMDGWFATTMRGGIFVYFESTPQARQHALLAALHKAGPAGFATWFEQGMLHWQNAERAAAVDHWVQANEDLAWDWFWKAARSNREMLLEFGAS
jgi:hypothetical protein